MTAALIAATALAAGYGLGRYRPAHRASDWANWQRYGTRRPTRVRRWAVWTVLSVENIGWLLTHPVQGWDAWRHRNNPPPPPAPPVRIRNTRTPDETA
ncbi:hypothetical protein ACFYPN_15925 [Streptomyces sp. NPDC005576]|uniref:hypothetical protein n=1 Tax=Streptomyces sp. NPDC005576 TaxID=3364726 RepID=UPI0036B31150